MEIVYFPLGQSYKCGSYRIKEIPKQRHRGGDLRGTGDGQHPVTGTHQASQKTSGGNFLQ